MAKLKAYDDFTAEAIMQGIKEKTSRLDLTGVSEVRLREASIPLIRLKEGVFISYESGKGVVSLSGKYDVKIDFEDKELINPAGLISKLEGHLGNEEMLNAWMMINSLCAQRKQEGAEYDEIANLASIRNSIGDYGALDFYFQQLPLFIREGGRGFPDNPVSIYPVSKSETLFEIASDIPELKGKQPYMYGPNMEESMFFNKDFARAFYSAQKGNEKNLSVEVTSDYLFWFE